MYAYPDARNDSLKGSLEEDGWEIRDEESDSWVIAQNGSLKIFAYKGTEDWFVGPGGLRGQYFMSGGTYQNYEISTEDDDSLIVGVKKGYADLFEQETGGIDTVTNFLTDADEDETFIFTGHSKGGLFAQIAGIIAMGSEERQNTSVVTYGTPPIFSATGATVIGDNMYEVFLRVSKEDDPIVSYNPTVSYTPKSCNAGMGYSFPSEKSLAIEDMDEDHPALGAIRDLTMDHPMVGYLVYVYDLSLSDCLN